MSKKISGERNQAAVFLPLMAIGETLRWMIEERRLSQKEVAARAGMDPSTLSRILRGHSVPAVSSIERIAEAMGLQIEDVFHADQTPSDGMREAKEDEERKRIGPPQGDSVPWEVVTVPAIAGRAAFDVVTCEVVAEVACGYPIDYSVAGETALVKLEDAPDPEKGEVLIRARGDSMTEYGIQDGYYVVIDVRPGGVAASGELIIAWYEPADGSMVGGITLKHWIRKGGRKILQGSTPETTYELKEGDVFELKGIVRRAFPPVLFFPRISG